MTINEIFNYIDDTHPHRFSDSTLMIWANQIDEKVYTFIKDFEPNSGETIPDVFTKHTDKGDDVLADNIEMYSSYIIAKIDFANTEYSHYNNDVAVFNQEYEEFTCDYIRTHTSKLDKYMGY